MDTLSRVVSRSSVQAIVTLALVGTFCWGFAVPRLIAADQFVSIVTIVVTFWFVKAATKP